MSIIGQHLMKGAMYVFSGRSFRANGPTTAGLDGPAGDADLYWDCPAGSMPETFAYEVPEERALATIRAFFAGPFNFLDTAASYGDGESERRIGIVLRELGGLPLGFVLATKADRDLQTGVFTGPQMRRSLRLLGLERLQLVHLHDPEHISFEEAMQPS